MKKVWRLLRDFGLLALAGLVCYQSCFAITHSTYLAVSAATAGGLVLFLVIVNLWDKCHEWIELSENIVPKLRLKAYGVCIVLREVIPR